MQDEPLVAFFQECGYGLGHAEILARPLQRIVQDTEKYQQLIGILNDIRLNAEKDENGRESRSEPERER